MTVIGNELALRWTDGTENYFPLDFLRKRCPCALCSGEKDLLGNVYRGELKLGLGKLSIEALHDCGRIWTSARMDGRTCFWNLFI